MPDLFVVIPTHGRVPLLEQTLASLSACRRPPDYRGTIVIENGSRAGAEQVVAAADPGLSILYLHEDRGNKSHALNVALRRIPDAFVVFLDDDVQLHPESLTAYAAARERHPGRHFFGGPCDAEWEREPPDWLKPLLPASARGWAIEEPRGPIADAVFLGSNWAAEAADILEAGGFDPTRGPGTPSMGQESDMMHRLVNRGWTGIYVPEALVRHHVPWERCSPEWTIARATRLGASLAHCCRLTGQSIWARAAYYTACQPLVHARVAIASLRGDEAAMTRAACKRNRRAAFIREVVRVRRRDPGASASGGR